MCLNIYFAGSFEVDPNLYVDPEWSTPPNRSAPTSCASSDCSAVVVTTSYKRRGSVPCETPTKVQIFLHKNKISCKSI